LARVRKRFGSIFPFLEQGATERRIGRLVANHDFIKALLTYGDFDEFVLGNPSAANSRDFMTIVQGWNLPEARLQQIRPVALPELPETLARDDFHVFHVGGWGSFMPGLHQLRGRYARSPFPITGVIFSIHSRDSVDLAFRMTRAEMASYDGIACLSHDGRLAMQKLLDGAAAFGGGRFAGRLDPLPLGIDDALLDVRGDRAAARRRLQVPDEAVVLLVLGRITPTQKMDLAPLLKAFAQHILPRAQQPVILALAGGGSEADVRLLNEMIDAYGVRSHTRVHANFLQRMKADLLAGADVLLSPVDNTQETFGLSLLEAQGAGLPVVASRFDGYKDLVREGVDGYLIETSWCEADPVDELFDVMDPNVAQLVQGQSVAVDMRQLADRVLTLVHDADRRRRMGMEGRAKVDRVYRFSAVIREYEAWWQTLADEAQRVGLPPHREPAASFSPARVFGHYASRTLTAETRVIATDTPADPPYNEIRPLYDQALVDRAIAAAASPVTIGDLVITLTHGSRDGAPGDVHAGAVEPKRVWFIVLWLLKYDRLRLAPA
jgi:glycosyltransferase involved in cell wall biosynthesis